MKKIIAFLLCIALMVPGMALASTTGYLSQRIATRTGPSTKYTEPGSFLKAGDTVQVHTKVWDSANEIWWVQVEFTAYNGARYRGYTGAWRMSVNLNEVPQEQALQSCRVTKTCWSYAGPGTNYVCWSDQVYAGTNATMWEVENGYGLIDCYDSNSGLQERVWVDLNNLNCGYQYLWDDTYPDYGDHLTIFSDPASAFEHPSAGGSDGYYDNGSTSVNSGTTNSWFVGETAVIITNEGNARSGAGVEYKVLENVFYGERYRIYAVDKASNGKTWFKIRVDGQYCWISAGIAEINGIIY